MERRRSACSTSKLRVVDGTTPLPPSSNYHEPPRSDCTLYVDERGSQIFKLYCDSFYRRCTYLFTQPVSVAPWQPACGVGLSRAIQHRGLSSASAE